MKLGFFTAPYASQPLLQTLVTLRSKYSPDQLECLELGTGNYPPNGHCDLNNYLDNPARQEELRALLGKYNFSISALSCHGNPVHPRAEIASSHNSIQERTIKLAGQMGIETVVAFSGLQGDGHSKTPIWVTNPWPDEQFDLYQKQLGQQADYWNDATQLADRNNVNIAIELHPNMFMHNVKTFREVKERIRVGGGEHYKRLMVNPDLSHFVWRGIDEVAVIRELGSDIGYMHAKDALKNNQVIAVNGNMDSSAFSDPQGRAWSFVYVGSGDINWRNVVRELRRVGYDGVLSIEHEDGEMDASESLDMAVNHLNALLPRQKPGPMTWAER